MQLQISGDLSEAQSLELLSEMQAELRDALDALAGQQGEGLLEHYRFYTSAHINRAAEGYIWLRTSQRIGASKHLVRTAIEAVIRIHAINKKPDLLFRIAFTEFNEDKKWVRSSAKPDAADATRAIDTHWTAFKQAYREKYPEHQLVEKELSLRRAAECAGMEGYYDSHYRLYCRFTHAAFRASTGDLNQFDREDNCTMTLCVLCAVEALVSVGAPAPNLASLKERLFQS